MNEDRITVTLNRKWPRLEGLPQGRITGEQWRHIDWPPCPKCGATIEVDRIDVRQLGDPFYLHYYMPGEWRCPNECDPRETS